MLRRAEISMFRRTMFLMRKITAHFINLSSFLSSSKFASISMISSSRESDSSATSKIKCFYAADIMIWVPIPGIKLSKKFKATDKNVTKNVSNL